MIRLLAFSIIAAFALAAIYAGTHYSRAPNGGLPIVHAALPICVPPALHWQFKQKRIA